MHRKNERDGEPIHNGILDDDTEREIARVMEPWDDPERRTVLDPAYELGREGKYVEGIALLEAYLTHHPDDIPIILTIADFEGERGYVECEAMWWQRAAALHLERGATLEAVTSLEHAARIEGLSSRGRVECLAMLGDFYERVGWKDRALDTYREALAMTPYPCTEAMRTIVFRARALQ